MDTSVTDLPRVLALPGTIKKKGENSEERPWRATALVGEGTAVSTEEFAAFASKIVGMWDERKIRRWVVKVPRFEQFHNGKVSLIGYLRKYAKVSEDDALKIVNLYTWLRGDSDWDFEAEEDDNEGMVHATFGRDGEISIKHLLTAAGEPPIK